MGTKISSLPAAGTLTGTEIVVMDQGGNTVTAPSGNMGIWVRTAAEISAGVTPTNYGYLPGDAYRYGCKFDGTTDDTAALNKCLSVAGTAVFPASQTAVVSGTLTHDISKVLIEGNGATLNFTSMTSGPAWNITTTNADPTTQYLVHRAHPLRNLYIFGPDKSSNVDCFYATPILVSSAYWMGGLLWDNVGIRGFRNAYTDCAGAIFWEWRGGGLNSDVGFTAGVFFKLTTNGAQNSGENHQLNHVIVGNCQGVIWDSAANANCDIYAVDCSFDGVDFAITGGSTVGEASASANLIMQGGHIEDWTASNYLGDTDHGILLTGVTFVVGTPSATQVMFNSTASGQGYALSRGVQLDNCLFSVNTGTWTPYICNGTGPFSARGSKIQGIFSPPLFSQFNNQINNFTLAGASPLASWTTSGTVTSDTTTVPSGTTPTPTASIKIAGVGSAATKFSLTTEQLGLVSYYAMTSGMSSGDTLTTTINYLDANGVNIGSTSTVNANGTSIAWTYFYSSLGSAVGAPPTGTVTAEIEFAVTGGGTAWIALPMAINA